MAIYNVNKDDIAVRVLGKIAKGPQGIETGYKRIDEITGGLMGGQLYVIGSRPAMGKTALALNIAEHLAIKQDKKNAFTALYRHGTGVQKVNQLFADELMMVLRYDSKSPKLVLFSDSRQAAAKLSAGIELDHYRDSLRNAIMNSLGSHSGVKSYLEKIRNEEMRYKELPDDIKAQIRNDNYLDHIRTLINNELDGDKKMKYGR